MEFRFNIGKLNLFKSAEIKADSQQTKVDSKQTVKTQDHHTVSTEPIENQTERKADLVVQSELRKTPESQEHTVHKGSTHPVKKEISDKLNKIKEKVFGPKTKQTSDDQVLNELEKSVKERQKNPSTLNEAETRQLAIDSYKVEIGKLKKGDNPKKTEIISKLEGKIEELMEKSIEERKERIGKLSETELHQLAIDQYELEIGKVRRNLKFTSEESTTRITKLEKAIQSRTQKLKEAESNAKLEKRKVEKQDKDGGMMAQVLRGLTSVTQVATGGLESLENMLASRQIAKETKKEAKETIADYNAKYEELTNRGNLNIWKPEYHDFVNNLSDLYRSLTDNRTLFENSSTEKSAIELKNNLESELERIYQDNIETQYSKLTTYKNMETLSKLNDCIISAGDCEFSSEKLKSLSTKAKGNNITFYEHKCTDLLSKGKKEEKEKYDGLARLSKHLNEFSSKNEEIQARSNKLKDEIQSEFKIALEGFRNEYENKEIKEKNVRDFTKLSRRIGYITLAQEPLSTQAKDLKAEIDKKIKSFTMVSIENSMITEESDKVLAIKMDGHTVEKKLEVQVYESIQAPTLNDLAPIYKNKTIAAFEVKKDVVPINIQKIEGEPTTVLATDQKMAYWIDDGQPVKTVHDKDSGVQIAVVNGYEIVTDQNNQRKQNGDPIVDAMVAKWYGKKVLLLSQTDGSGGGEAVLNTANAANKGFVDHAEQHLKNNSVTNHGDLAELMINSVASAQNAIIDGANSSDPNIRTSNKGATLINGTERTTHLGGIISRDEATGNVSGYLSSLGDQLGVIYNEENGTLKFITEVDRSGGIAEPGGQLGGIKGHEYSEKFADYRNLSLYHFEAKAAIEGKGGDVLLVMSDGVHDNFDPEFNGHLTPESAINEMFEAVGANTNDLTSIDSKGLRTLIENKKIPSNWKFESKEVEEGNKEEIEKMKNLNLIRNNYVIFKMSQVIRKAKEEGKGDSIATTLTTYAYNLGEKHRELAASTPNFNKEEYDAHRELYTGKRDHISCMEIPF